MRLIQWIRNWFYEHQFYKITAQGDQVSMMDSTPYAYILHIQRIGCGLKYHFIKDSYQLITPYEIVGMSIFINDKSYILPSNEFIVQGNELFTEPLTLWLCKHYLYIEPSSESTLTIIDENIDIHSCSNLIVQNNLQNDIKYNP
jgi:hypothetical protein